MGSGGLFLTGLAQGFGKSFLQQRQQKHAEELNREANQYKMFKDALSVATSRRDDNAISYILKSMDEFSSESGGGKKGRANQTRILSHFAEMLQSGREEKVTSPESVAAEKANQQLIEGGQPQEATRPRLATQTSIVNKPLLLSNQEIDRQNIESDVAKQKALAPGLIDQYKQQQGFLLQERAKARAEEINTKFENSLIYLDAKSQLDAQKKLKELTTLVGGDETKAKELYLAQVEAGLEKTKSTTLLNNTRTSFIGKNYELAEKRYQESIRYHNALIARGIEASNRGDKALANRIDKAVTGSKEIIASMAIDRDERARIQSEINTKERLKANMLDSNDPRIQEYNNELEDLTRQYYEVSGRLKDRQDKLDAISKDLEEKRLSSSSSTAPKTLLKGKDESGYRVGQEVDGTPLGYPGVTLIYKGLSHDGQAIFKPKKEISPKLSKGEISQELLDNWESAKDYHDDWFVRDKKGEMTRFKSYAEALTLAKKLKVKIYSGY